MKIGFIGIGVMGLPMSTNLLKKSGHPVMVYDLNAGAVAQMEALGASSGSSPAEIAAECDIIFTMLPRNEHVRSVYGQLLPHIRPGQIYVDMSTISPTVSCETAEAVRAHGADMADAPVVKSQPAAVSGTLGIYVGGRKETYETILPLLQCMGSNVIHLGDNGAGLVMKLCHNALVAQIQNGVNETLHLARAVAGIGASTFRQAASYGGAQTFYLDTKADNIQRGDYTPAFFAAYMHKDLMLAKDLYAQTGLKLPGLELTVANYDAALEKGWGKEDFSCTYKLLDEA